MTWHVQVMGEGPVLLLVHGAGASTHSWRDLMTPLAQHFQVVAVDLPGHGFSGSPARYRPTLPRISALLGQLCRVLGLEVKLAVGHSAGAAIVTRMALDGRIKPDGLVSFNGAYQPFDGAAGQLFPALAKLLFVNPLTPRIIALTGRDPKRVQRLIEGTGSLLDAQALSYYQILMRSPGHIAGVLGMMANWDLAPLGREVVGLRTPLLLVAGSKDRAVPPFVSRDLATHVPGAQYEEWEGLGHLAHEEAPQRSVDSVFAFARSLAIL